MSKGKVSRGHSRGWVYQCSWGSGCTGALQCWKGLLDPDAALTSARWEGRLLPCKSVGPTWPDLIKLTLQHGSDLSSRRRQHPGLSSCQACSSSFSLVHLTNLFHALCQTQHLCSPHTPSDLVPTDRRLIY